MADAKTNRSELVKMIAEKTDLTQKQVGTCLSALSDTVNEEIAKGRNVHFEGIFTIQVGKRNGRTGRNPRTGDPLVIEAKAKVNIKPARRLKTSVETIDVTTID